MTQPQPPQVKRGQVLKIPEAHYLYGRGLLELRVTACAPIHRGQEWVRIVGTQIIWDGTDGERRDVLVRVAALPEILAGTATPSTAVPRPTNGLRISDPAEGRPATNERPPLPSHGRPRRWDEGDEPHGD